MTVYIEKLEALAKAAKAGGAEWSDLDINTERMYVAEGALVRLYEFATPAVLLQLCNDNEALRGLYQMHKQTETREMRDLKAENAGLKTGYEAYERVNAELTQRLANLELCQTASLGVSGIIRSAASELGFDAAGEDSALDHLIGLARAAAALRAEVDSLTREADRQYTTIEAYRKDAERYQWFRNQHWDSSAICAVVDPRLTTKLGAYCPSGNLLDDAVDAGISMSKEQSHD